MSFDMAWRQAKILTSKYSRSRYLLDFSKGVKESLSGTLQANALTPFRIQVPEIYRGRILPLSQLDAEALDD
jgi:hypothetical protein